jgi:hypothetical protein
VDASTLQGLLCVYQASIPEEQDESLCQIAAMNQ